MQHIIIIIGINHATYSLKTQKLSWRSRDLYSYLKSKVPCQDYVHGEDEFKNVSVNNNVHESKFRDLWREHKNINNMASWAMHIQSTWQLT